MSGAERTKKTKGTSNSETVISVVDEDQSVPDGSSILGVGVEKEVKGYFSRIISWLSLLLGLDEFWSHWTAVLALVAMFTVFSIVAPAFFTAGNLESVLAESAVLIIMAIGQMFVILTAGIDLSQAAVLTIAAVTLGEIIDRFKGAGVAVPMLLALATGAAAGVVNGVIIAKAKITDFIVTLGMLGVASGAALVLTHGSPTEVISSIFDRLYVGKLGPIPYPFLIAAIIAGFAYVLLRWTAFGLHIFATGGDREAARAVGVRIDRVRVVVYVFSGLLVGIAAVLYTAQIGETQPALNTTLLLDSIAAVVLGGVSLFGGKGNVIGVVAGAILLTMVQNGLTLMSVSEFYEPAVVGLIVIVAALMMRFERT